MPCFVMMWPGYKDRDSDEGLLLISLAAYNKVKSISSKIYERNCLYRSLADETGANL